MEKLVEREEIGRRLVALRGDIRQNVAAKGIGITTAALANYESGTRVPRDEVKVLIANYYKTTVSQLFFCA